MNMQERICTSLQKRGWTEEQSKTRKARTFRSKHGGALFVGKRGSVRTGVCYSKSIPISRKLVHILNK
jgi:hypothetical protein